MKKVFTSILLISITAASALAQAPLKSTATYSAHTVPSPVSAERLVKNARHPNTRGTGEWYNYLAAEYFSNPYGSTTSDYLFPDSSIMANYGSVYLNPFFHSACTVLDPKSELFDYPLLSSDYYTLDSVAFAFNYYRNLPDNVVDTLLLTVFDDSKTQGNVNNLTVGDLPAGFAIDINYSVNDVYFAVVPYNSVTHSPEPLVTGALQFKIPLTKSFQQDTVAGLNQVLVSTSALGILDSGSLVVATATFIPGYHYSLNDTLNSEDFILITSLEENGTNTFPNLTSDWNSSGVVNNQDQYNNHTGFDSIYIPSFAFPTGFGLEDHNFGFHITVDNNVATAVKPVASKSQSLTVSPNPCFNCIVKGAENVNDLLVTDLLGRMVPVSYNKSSSSSYQLNIPSDRTGLFIVKNIKTGEVVKFVKE